ncbi:MFS transporter [Asanoa sp. NPDC050611]|uniref:MFS transporter n=1 Tax=Asanoa sp. NPDC050611 TaxID=3157098 RepID=UPI0033EC8238
MTGLACARLVHRTHRPRSAGWRAVFLANVPIGLAVLALTRRAPALQRTGRRIDWPAHLAAAAALALATDAVIAAGARSWPHVAWSLAGLAAAALLFRSLERRGAAPVLDRALLRAGGVRAGLLAAAAVSFALTGALFVLPLLLAHLGPLRTGLALLPMTVPFVTNPPLTGRIVARVGPRAPILAGLGVLTTGGAALAAPVFVGGGYPWLVPGLLLTGLGVSLVLPALVAALVRAAPPGAAGAVGGVLNAVRQVGATLGVAVMGAAARTGWSLVFSAVCCAAAWLVFRRSRRPVPVGGRG